jgi:protease IV
LSRGHFGALLATLVLALAGGCGRTPFPRMKSLDRALSTEPHIAVFDLSRPFPEAVVSKGFLPRAPERTFSALTRLASEVLGDDNTVGVLIKLGSQEFNWAQVEELGRVFAVARSSAEQNPKTKKPVYCHADALGNSTLWLAISACEQIWLSPAGGVDAVGIAGQSIYIKELLDRLKVRPDFLHMGRYKSAAETFTHNAPSEASLESMLGVLKSIRQSWRDGVGKSRSQAVASLEQGPWPPEIAKERSLVDHVGYESEAREALTQMTNSEDFVAASGAKEGSQSADELASLVRMLVGVEHDLREPHVVILPAQGSIAMGGGGPLGDGGIHAGRMRKVIRRLKDDESVKAVVLRIDSPGGSALASDLLWHDLTELKQKKPLIASVGSMAASGGYYMACAADHIIAEATSIVGSIGVVGGKFVVDEAAKEFGVTPFTFVASDEPGAEARAAYSSLFTPWDDAPRERVRHHMESVYELFLKRVSDGRSKPVDEIRKIAEGRIWSGQQGRDNGLVDELGGVSFAVAQALDRAGLPHDAPVVLEGGPESLLELLGFGAEAEEGDVRSSLLDAARMARGAQAEGPAWWAALSETQRTFVSSYAPLLTGEHVVASLPFLLETH